VSGDNRGNIAISADGSRILWIPQSATGPFYSTNNGLNWTVSTGGPSGTRIPFADRVNPGKFYVYSSAAGGRLFISVNGGANFVQGAAIGSGTAPRAVFGREGHIWLPRGSSGLSRSVNSGTNFTAVSGVQQANYISFGLAAPGGSYPAVFLIGRANNDGGLGIYRPDNEGGSWTRINDNQNQFGLSWTHAFAADRQVFGRIFFGTEGRGIVYGQPVLQPPAVPTNLAASAGDATVTLSWSASAGATSYYVKRSLLSGGPYATIATNASVSFTNTGLNNGTLYYFVASAVNAADESLDSAEASARPTSALPASLNAVAAGNRIRIEWPLGHTGWWLQAQTNAPGVGLDPDWFTITEAASTNQVTFPIDALHGSVFFRLIHP
jgi:hypothetical protein